MRASSLETALEKVSRVITDRYGLRLICRGNRCRTNGRTIYLPSLPDNVPDELLGAIRGWSDHECAHGIYTQTQIAPAFQEAHGPEAFGILNALEDARVERLMGRRYPGAKLNLEEGFRFVGERAMRRAAPPPEALDQFTSALYTRASHRPDQPWISQVGYELADECEGELSELRSCRRTKDVAELAVRIWDKMCGKLPQKEQSAGSTAAAGEGGPEAPADSQLPQDKQQQAGPAGEPEEPQPAGASPAACDGEPEGLPMERLGSLVQGELEQLYSGDNGGTYRVYTKEHDVVEVPKPRKDYDYRKELEELKPYVAGLRRRLLQTLMGRKQTLWLGDRTRGSLDPRSLHRLITCSSNRIFRKRIETEGKNTACTLLLDISSSMSGKSIDLCRQLGLVFAESLSVLGFPTEIIGFSTLDMDLRVDVARETGVSEEELAKRFARFVPVYHAVYKQFNEPWRKVAGRFGSVATRSLTPLGESLLFAGKRLASRPEKRKVLFCLTDGKPVVGAWDEQVTFEHACEAVKKLQRAGIEPVGIGILEESVRHIFPSNAVIHQLDDLPRSFLTQLCKVLTSR